MLMVYAGKKNLEILWNSRDGVTPFRIAARDVEEMNHVAWQSDVRMHDFIPPCGMRIFITATEELIRPSLLAYVEEGWDRVGYSMKESFETKEAAYAALLPSWLGTEHHPEGLPCAPLVVEVTEEIQRGFRLEKALTSKQPHRRDKG